MGNIIGKIDRIQQSEKNIKFAITIVGDDESTYNMSNKVYKAQIKDKLIKYVK